MSAPHILGISSVDIAVGLAFFLTVGLGSRWILANLQLLHKNYKKKIVDKYDEMEKNLSHMKAKGEHLRQEELNLEVQVARMHALAHAEIDFIWKQCLSKKEEMSLKYANLYKKYTESLLREAKRKYMEAMIQSVKDMLYQTRRDDSDIFYLESSLIGCLKERKQS